MIKNVILDVDATLLDWYGGFMTWLSRYGFTDIKNADVSTHCSSDMDSIAAKIKLKSKDGCTVHPNDETLRGLIEMFNASAAFGKLVPYADSVKALHLMHNKGFTLNVVSSYTNDYESMKLRENNLINVYGNIFNSITSLPLDSSKVEYLKNQPRDSFIIEDSVSTLESAVKLDFDYPDHLLLIGQNHNLKAYKHSKYKEYMRWVGWRDILEIFNEY